MEKKHRILTRLKALEQSLAENLKEVRELIIEVQGEEMESRPARVRKPVKLPDPYRLYELVPDFDVLEEVFQTSDNHAVYYLQNVAPPGVATHGQYTMTWVCNPADKDRPAYIFTLLVPPAELFNSRLNKLIEAKFEERTPRFLKSLLNNHQSGQLNYRYFYFQGLRYFAINVTESTPTVNARPVTYWFNISALDTLDVLHKQSLQRNRGYDFVETFRL